MSTVTVRYFVDDVDAAVGFYTQHLGFTVTMRPAPSVAMLQRESLRLLLNATVGPGGAAQPMPDGRKPEPGGWTASSSRPRTSTARWQCSAKLEPDSATTSSPASAAGRSCSTIRPGIPSNCSSRRGSDGLRCRPDEQNARSICIVVRSPWHGSL